MLSTKILHSYDHSSSERNYDVSSNESLFVVAGVHYLVFFSVVYEQGHKMIK